MNSVKTGNETRLITTSYRPVSDAVYLRCWSKSVVKDFTSVLCSPKIKASRKFQRVNLVTHFHFNQLIRLQSSAVNRLLRLLNVTGIRGKTLTLKALRLSGITLFGCEEAIYLLRERSQDKNQMLNCWFTFVTRFTSHIVAGLLQLSCSVKRLFNVRHLKSRRVGSWLLPCFDIC